MLIKVIAIVFYHLCLPFKAAYEYHDERIRYLLTRSNLIYARELSLQPEK